MELDPVLLSRVQFAFVISFHIIFPAFTIGLAAWLATLEGARLLIGNELYRRIFDFWLKIFALSFGMGVVSGIVMAFQFGTNWSVLAERTGSIQGPLLGYETFTAFMLEATFFGVVLLGRDRVPPWFYFLSCCMVSLGTMFSSFWILANNSWMQMPLGHVMVNGRIEPGDWWAITTGPIMKTQQPASEVLIALPDPFAERNLFPIEIPRLGSFIASGNWTAREIGLETFPPEDRPPVIIPFFAFRIMVGMGLIMLAVSWFGTFLRWRGRLESTRWFLWVAFLSFPSGFIAVLAGWFTAEVGRQPWVVYGLLRTKDAVTPSLTTGDVLISLACYVIAYATIFSFGLFFIYRLLRDGPGRDASDRAKMTPARPLAVAMQSSTEDPR
jgi:cytochrome bd-type quinol oxidase subunit 1